VVEPDDVTFGVPRFLSFIELGYLYEAAKIADVQLARKIDDADADNDDKRNLIGNINATRQSLLRSVFISSYAILEQHFDEIVTMEKSRHDILISPSDLKDRGIGRSLSYFKKVLKRDLDTNVKHWKDLALLQEVRNHLVHYGPGFGDTSEHEKRFAKFENTEYVSLRPMVCFSIEQIEKIFDLYMVCIEDFSK